MPDQTRPADTAADRPDQPGTAPTDADDHDSTPADGTRDAGDSSASSDGTADADPSARDADRTTTDRFPKLDDAGYDRVDAFLDGYVRFTPREWAVAVLCADFRTGTGVEMQRVGEHLPDMVPFVTEAYTRQEVNDARRSFELKVREAAATFFYGAFSGLLTADEVDDVTYEAIEVAKFLLEVEGSSLSLDEERSVEDHVRRAMREIHTASAELRYDHCPECGATFDDGES